MSKVAFIGWGWGVPTTWQGWVVLASFVVLVVAIGIAFPPSRAPWTFGIGIVVLCAVLTAICYATGEPPAWRWGSK